MGLIGQHCLRKLAAAARLPCKVVQGRLDVVVLYRVYDYQKAWQIPHGSLS
jgi:hypothetical protein